MIEQNSVRRSNHVMDRFEKLVLRAAETKRKDIVDRYGQDGCTKLIAKKKDETKGNPELERKNYESTIRNLLEAWESSPRDRSRTTKNIDKIIDGALTMDLKKETQKNQKRRGTRSRSKTPVVPASRRHSLEV